MKAIQSRESSDSILANELPIIAMQSIRMKTITQKKKGLAGLFGKKERRYKSQYITNEIQDFNKRIDFSQRLEKQSDGNLCGQPAFTEQAAKSKII